MKKLFNDLLEIEGVHGVLYLSSDGKLLFKEFHAKSPADLDSAPWPAFVAAFSDIREAELIYDTRRIYLRRGGSGCILISMELTALVAMVRLNCDIILPSLDDQKKPTKGIGRFFK